MHYEESEISMKAVNPLSNYRLEDLVVNPQLAQQGGANDEGHFAIGFDGAFDDAVIDRLLKDQHPFTRLQDDPRFKQMVKDYLRPRVYTLQRSVLDERAE